MPVGRNLVAISINAVNIFESGKGICVLLYLSNELYIHVGNTATLQIVVVGYVDLKACLVPITSVKKVLCNQDCYIVCRRARAEKN